MFANNMHSHINKLYEEFFFNWQQVLIDYVVFVKPSKQKNIGQEKLIFLYHNPLQSYFMTHTCSSHKIRWKWEYVAKSWYERQHELKRKKRLRGQWVLVQILYYETVDSNISKFKLGLNLMKSLQNTAKTRI